MDLYNDSHEKVCILSGIKETCITSTLKTGDKEITFEFRKTNRYAADIKEEGYIRTDTDEFVIKQVEPRMVQMHRNIERRGTGGQTISAGIRDCGKDGR